MWYDHILVPLKRTLGSILKHFNIFYLKKIFLFNIFKLFMFYVVKRSNKLQVCFYKSTFTEMILKSK